MDLGFTPGSRIDIEGESRPVSGTASDEPEIGIVQGITRHQLKIEARHRVPGVRSGPIQRTIGTGIEYLDAEAIYLSLATRHSPSWPGSKAKKQRLAGFRER